MKSKLDFFFPITYQKSWLYYANIEQISNLMLIGGQFIGKDLNLWSTLLFVRFEKLNFSDF